MQITSKLLYYFRMHAMCLCGMSKSHYGTYVAHHLYIKKIQNLSTECGGMYVESFPQLEA